MNVLITGHSKGIGAGLANVFLNNGHHVSGISRTLLKTECINIQQYEINLKNKSNVIDTLSHLVYEIKKIPDVVFLNAGILGPIASLQNTKSTELQHVMDINVWVNKVILDWFLKN